MLPTFNVERRALDTDDSLPKLTDFNDLHVAEGIALVTQQIDAAIASLQVPVVPSAVVAVDDVVPAISAPLPDTAFAAPAAANGGAGEDGFTLAGLLARFSLIIGERRVWDSVEQMVMKWPAYAALVGRGLASEWEARIDKRTMRQSDLPKIKRGKAVDEATMSTSAMLLARYTLLYGTETVWDAENRMVLSLSALRAAYGGDSVKFWQENLCRKND
ncbi:hypothetical protein HQN60_00035 [Deefgea piscis]|uniref:Uncharacterized protein n=1 Tax=Deefgea piscis TaxID=2739061 RepID=A0A6M8SJN5_9NEIS|nr:hypothetical protein [Deefgea piscis]QKJ65253.1 hypothetical protein HQN60_00035 [Deefgea piscis]